MNEINPQDRAAVEAIVAELAAAWNAGDARHFAACFSTDAEQVNIFGSRLLGREEIAARHHDVFQTIFRGSANTLAVLDARYAAEDVLLVRLSSTVAVPQGPLSGTLQTIASLVLRKDDGRWHIVLFHNTRVAQPT